MMNALYALGALVMALTGLAFIALFEYGVPIAFGLIAVRVLR